MALIELKTLTKRYGPTIWALKSVTGSIDGKVIGLLGPNGAGKSTLLKCLLGLISFDGGAKVLGMDAHTHGVEIRDRVGYMPEQEAIIAGMTAVEMCTYAAELSGLPRKEAVQRAHAALYYAGIEDKRYQPVDSYSTGLKQRVKLAQALVHDPELLFLDEPTNGLDPRSREEMIELIHELPSRRGCSIVLSTHLLPDVERICDRAVIMHQGQIRFVGSVDELRQGTTQPNENALTVEVKADPEKLVDALGKAGATCKVLNKTVATVDLPEGASSALVFETARELGLQIRGLFVRRESMEVAFMRVIQSATPPQTGVEPR